MRQVELGIHDIRVDHGDHLCGLYAGARQRDELLIPFLEAGLRQGDKCMSGNGDGGVSSWLRSGP